MSSRTFDHHIYLDYTREFRDRLMRSNSFQFTPADENVSSDFFLMKINFTHDPDDVFFVAPCLQDFYYISPIGDGTIFSAQMNESSPSFDSRLEGRRFIFRGIPETLRHYFLSI